jgi:proline iminopeptidase
MQRMLLALFFCFGLLNAQELYVQSFGNKSDKAIVYLHGGPGYNSANFERTTAQELADQGFYVLVYDRRGEGRSEKMDSQFTFEETNQDLLAICESHKLKKVSLIGHSFGGVVATRFAGKYPEMVENIYYVGAPLSFQDTFREIIGRCKEIYTAKDDQASLKYIGMLENMDTTSLQYSSYSFMHAMQNGFYTPKEATAEAKALYGTFRTDSVLLKYAGKMGYTAPQGFWKNEQYTCIDLTVEMKKLSKLGVELHGLYGQEDGLFGKGQIANLKKLIQEDQFRYLENCSHNVYIDQQVIFLEYLKSSQE